MGSENQPVHNSGIYYSLPTFDSSFTGFSAIVTGANGISGFATLRVLLESPQRWTKVYALSRKPPPPEMMALLSEDERKRVQHVAVDFLTTPTDIAKALQSANVQAEYVFFYSYLQPKQSEGPRALSNAEELVKVNAGMLENLLNALPQAGITPRRVLLQTGAKTYGIHIGRHRTPGVESDPQPKHLEPNFYYPQEQLLFKYCMEHKADWNVIIPAWIVGSVYSAQINGFYPFAVYAAVQAHKNEAIAFPAAWENWQFEMHPSTARLTGYLSEWAVLEDKCANQRFNAQDTGPMSWDRFFHELARWFGVEKGVVPPPDEDEKYQVTKGASGKDTPMGYGPATQHRTSFSLVEWASKPENARAWEEIMAASQGRITSNPFESPGDVFAMGDGALMYMATMNMTKARRMGWTGFVDSIEGIFEMYQENVKMGLIPEMAVDSAKPLI